MEEEIGIEECKDKVVITDANTVITSITMEEEIGMEECEDKEVIIDVLNEKDKEIEGKYKFKKYL
jgi:hypothetical protein